MSPYVNGKMRRGGLTKGEPTWLQRWEHWACARGEVNAHLAMHGWIREPIPGKKWSSGTQAHRWVNTKKVSELLSTCFRRRDEPYPRSDPGRKA